MASSDRSKEPRSVIVKTFVADKEPSRVFDFFLNVKNWESGGVQRNISKADGDWWNTESVFGKAKIRLRPNREFGIFDHDYSAPGRAWTVYCRVTANERGSTISFQFVRPEGMPQVEFESQLANGFEIEMSNLKKAIESLT
jgi:hypothetical protein